MAEHARTWAPASCPLCGTRDDEQREGARHSCQPTPQLFALLDFLLGGDPATAPARQAIARAQQEIHEALRAAGLDPKNAKTVRDRRRCTRESLRALAHTVLDIAARAVADVEAATHE